MRVGGASTIMGIVLSSLCLVLCYANGAELWQAVVAGGVAGIFGVLAAADAD